MNTAVFVFRLAELPQLAAQLLPLLAQRPKVFLKGQMGAGKTTLVRAICQALGSQDEISSPTFPIIQQYRAGESAIFHVDLYRLNRAQEAIDIGMEDILYDSKAFVFVEWYGLVEDILPPNAMFWDLETVDEDTRRLSVR
jgi:tRNA threonylcarbamoyladenosine biosynthesis protein TsaE